MKKFLALFILIVMLLPFVVNAESVQTGRFKYMPAFENETEEVYYYSDDYFMPSGTIYNEHLHAMSMNLALSTFEIRGSSYSKELFEKIGFKDFEAKDMNEKPTLNTIGTVIGHKKIDGYQVVAVGIRGEKYDSELGFVLQTINKFKSKKYIN